MKSLQVLFILLACLSFISASKKTTAFNTAGNVLISDQFNNRVIEVDPTSYEIVWQYGNGPDDLTDSSPIGVNDAERVGSNTLISCTGIPAGGTPKCPKGCADNRVIIVDQDGKITFQYGTFGKTGSGDNELNTPVQSTYLPTGDILITDQGNQRVIQITQDKKIVWQYGTTGKTGKGDNFLNQPNSAELLTDGNVLIADSGNNRAIIVDYKKKTIISTYNIGGAAGNIAFASSLPNGDYLLTDASNNRIVEVDSKDSVVWSYYTNTQKGSNPEPNPSRAIKLTNGDIIISDQFNNRVISVNSAKKILETFGKLDKSGYSKTTTNVGLYAPYDAKVIGQYYGLTDPNSNGNGNGNGKGHNSSSSVLSVSIISLIIILQFAL